MGAKEQYSNIAIKLLHNAKKETWGIHFGYQGDKSIIIDRNSSTLDILTHLSLFTLGEFSSLTKGYEDLDVKPLIKPGPYKLVHEDDGIYVEKCDAHNSTIEGRSYAVISGDKKLCVGLSTYTGEKHMSSIVMERKPEGIYLYSSTSDEIRFISNDILNELCNLYRSLTRTSVNDTSVTNERIIDGLTFSTSLWALFARGQVVANKVSNGLPFDEEKINSLFSTGLKEYMEQSSLNVTPEYDEEIPEFTAWTR